MAAIRGFRRGAALSLNRLVNVRLEFGLAVRHEFARENILVLRDSSLHKLALLVLVASFLAAGCTSRPTTRVVLPPPVESSTVGPGDVFGLTILGEEKVPKEFRVAPDGSVDIPYIHRIQVAGLEPQQIADLIRTKLVAAQILQDPSVSIDVREYNSKRVVVIGQVQKPGPFPLVPGLTFIQAISMAGGFNAMANRDRVTLTRRTGKDSRTIVLSADAITDGSLPDFQLQAGDTIFVGERLF
jgi:polysaccharide export outer membrane protein